MPTKKLTIVDKENIENRAILKNAMKAGKPLMTGSDEWDYLCGNCMAVVCRQVPEYLNMVGPGDSAVLATCNACGRYNELPLAP